jgi:NAD(P)-dependent dehydrogenase (short-subunit alcohol dehydrogenase family)
VDYCVAKAGLNMLILHLQQAEAVKPEDERIAFWAVSPGFTKTAFNNFRGSKDPLDSAKAFVRLLEAPRGAIQPGTFWEFEEGEFRIVPW